MIQLFMKRSGSPVIVPLNLPASHDAKGLLPANVSRRTEIYFTRITCPTARKRATAVLTKVFLH